MWNTAVDRTVSRYVDAGPGDGRGVYRRIPELLDDPRGADDKQFVDMSVT